MNSLFSIEFFLHKSLTVTDTVFIQSLRNIQLFLIDSAETIKVSECISMHI